MTPDDEITATTVRNRLDVIGQDVERAIRDAYARGLADGLARARAEIRDAWPLPVPRRQPVVGDVAERRPTTV